MQTTERSLLGTLATAALDTEARHAELADQLRRATISIPLNIAKGAGKPTDKGRSRFHAIARRSAMECAAILDIMYLQD